MELQKKGAIAELILWLKENQPDSKLDYYVCDLGDELHINVIKDVSHIAWNANKEKKMDDDGKEFAEWAIPTFAPLFGAFIDIFEWDFIENDLEKKDSRTWEMFLSKPQIPLTKATHPWKYLVKEVGYMYTTDICYDGVWRRLTPMKGNDLGMESARVRAGRGAFFKAMSAREVERWIEEETSHYERPRRGTINSTIPEFSIKRVGDESDVVHYIGDTEIAFQKRRLLALRERPDDGNRDDW